jgi:hypothetical protein
MRGSGARLPSAIPVIAAATAARTPAEINDGIAVIGSVLRHQPG